MFRPEIYRRHLPAPDVPATSAPFDGIEFTAADVDAYLEQVPLSTSFVDPSRAVQP